MVQVIWQPEALRHIREIREYIEERDYPERAERVVLKITDAAKKLCKFPDLGSVVPELEGYREIRIFKWRILFTVSEDKQAVKIQGIWHGSRQLSKDAFGELEM